MTHRHTRSSYYITIIIILIANITQRPDETPLQNEKGPTEDKGVDRTGWYRPDPSAGDLDRKRFDIKCGSWRVVLGMGCDPS